MYFDYQSMGHCRCVQYYFIFLAHKMIWYCWSSYLGSSLTFLLRLGSVSVGSNSIQCTICHKWLHNKCSGIKGSMYKVMKLFSCRGCLNPVTSTGRTSVDIGASANLELVDMFCYLGDILSVDRDADAAVEAIIRIGWNKLRQLVPLLTNRD